MDPRHTRPTVRHLVEWTRALGRRLSQRPDLESSAELRVSSRAVRSGRATLGSPYKSVRSSWARLTRPSAAHRVCVRSGVRFRTATSLTITGLVLRHGNYSRCRDGSRAGGLTGGFLPVPRMVTSRLFRVTLTRRTPIADSHGHQAARGVGLVRPRSPRWPCRSTVRGVDEEAAAAGFVSVLLRSLRAEQLVLSLCHRETRSAVAVSGTQAMTSDMPGKLLSCAFERGTPVGRPADKSFHVGTIDGTGNANLER